MNTFKASVPLIQVVPSGTNPREDFGDIDALADSITATGGQPINPMVVVQDGNAYRVVDGERRLRALRKLHKGDQTYVVDAIVCAGYDEADEMVAMLATDDKRQLTEEERTHGVQRCLKLDVDERRVAKAAHVKESTVLAARRMAKHLPEGSQATLDQMARAATFDDQEDRDKVLEANPGTWERVADGIEQHNREVAISAAIRATLEAAGVTCHDKKETQEDQARLSYCGAASTLDNAKDFGGERLEAFPGWNGGWYVYEPRSDDGTETAEDAAERKERDRLQSMAGPCHDSMRDWAKRHDVFPTLVREWRMGTLRLPGGATPDEEVIDSPASLFERVYSVDFHANELLKRYCQEFDDEFCTIFDALTSDGWDGSEWSDLRAACGHDGGEDDA